MRFRTRTGMSRRDGKPPGGGRMRGKMKRKRKITAGMVLIYGVLLLGAVSCLLPVLNMIALSFSESSVALTGNVYFWPQKFTLAAYRKLMTEGNFLRSFFISVARVAVQLAVTMPVTIMMAYALSKDKRDFAERDILAWVAVFTMLFSGGLIPTYMVVKGYGLLNSFWALILPGALNVYNMIIMMNFFRGIPVELEEAAVMDGAGAWVTLMRIYLPLSLPTLATIILFTAVGSWNDFFAGMIYITNVNNYPLQTYIRSLALQADYNNMNPTELQERMKIAGITFNAAKIVVSMVPVLIIYPFLQRYFVSGLVMGAVKG